MTETAMAVPRLRVHADSDFGTFAGHWPRSRQMGDAACHVFQCAEVIEVWLDTLGRARGTRPVFVGVYDAAHRPIMLLALGIERRRGSRVLSFLDGTVFDYNQPIVFPTASSIDAADRSMIWPAIVRALPPFDAVVLDKLPERVGGLPNFLVQLGAVPTGQSGHAMSLVGSGSELEARLPYRKVRNRLRRQLSSLGPVAFRVAASAPEAEALLRQVFALKAQQFRRTRVPGFGLPGKREFYVAATRLLACPETVHVSALTVGDATIACQWGLVLHGRFYLLLTAYDEAWKRFSPGALHHEALIRWCHARGMSSFDFGIGDEAYKAGYCDSSMPLYRLELPMSVMGRTYLATERLLIRLRATRAWKRLRPLKWGIVDIVRDQWRRLAPARPPP